MTDLRWFNLHPDFYTVWGLNVKLFNCFNRHTDEGEHFWGFGVLQIGSRHLFCVSTSGVSVLFLGRTQ